jgi:hypothetical protein
MAKFWRRQVSTTEWDGGDPWPGFFTPVEDTLKAFTEGRLSPQPGNLRRRSHSEHGLKDLQDPHQALKVALKGRCHPDAASAGPDQFQRRRRAIP